MDESAAAAIGWYALSTHPCGESPLSWFEMIGTMVYAAAGNPSGPSARPWFQVRGELVFPVDGHPDGPSPQPTFLLVDDLVSPILDARWHLGSAPWFRVEPESSGFDGA
jgi:hypothetical protein